MKNAIDGFNIRLTEKMQARNLTQADLCRLTGLTTSMISHYCAGQRLPNIPAALKIAKALNTTVEYLAQGTSTYAVSPYSVAEDEILYASQKSQRTTSKQSLVSLIQLLNEDGQSKVISYTEDLLLNNKYKR